MKKKIVLPLMLCMVLGVIFLIANHVPQRLVDDLLYDNYNHYLPCERLPKSSEIKQVLLQNADAVAQLHAISHDVDIQLGGTRCPGTDYADIVIYYPGHSQRVEIEGILGGKTFFGIPVRWRNR